MDASDSDGGLGEGGGVVGGTGDGEPVGGGDGRSVQSCGEDASTAPEGCRSVSDDRLELRSVPAGLGARSTPGPIRLDSDNRGNSRSQPRARSTRETREALRVATCSTCPQSHSNGFSVFAYDERKRAGREARR